ncbi:hypothetical protein IFR05_008320 [Cadophora sp. M221]|nr:hypothetical protein IFR05_008320 [Cadophora sp. M221]
MNRCPLALSRVKNLHVGIYVYRGSNNDFWPQILEPSNPPSELPTLLGDVLEWMTRLEQLTWGMGSGDACFFEEPLMARNLSLPSVTSLELGASSHYLVGMCPNLEKLESGGGWYSSRLYDADELDWRVLFIQSAASATKLKSFGMDGSFKGWSPELATEVVKAMPQIENLRIRGSVGHSSYAEDNDKLKDMLEILGQLKNLTHIEIPYSANLALGFDGGAWCGNAYGGKDGREYGRTVAKESAETREKAGDMVMSSLLHLKSFEIGELAPNITRAENGTVTLIWPWTGRMDEWTFEIWPEEDEFDEVEYDSM